MNLIIRRLTVDDCADVYQIEKDTFPTPWSEAAFKEEINNDLAHFFVAVYENEIVGYSDIWIAANEAHLLNIAVKVDYRGRGIGKALLDHSHLVAVKNGVKMIFLEVRISNNNAISLYEKYGYITVGIRKRYYKDGEDALLMAVNITD